MIGNVVLDLLLTVAGVGVGDLVANLVLPCNSRNAFLLQRHLERRGRRQNDLEAGPSLPAVPARAATSPAAVGQGVLENRESADRQVRPFQH